jgi:hypothetical protein
MVNPTNLEPRRFVPRTGRDVWAFPGPPGYLESIQAAGSVAAPLLAGASFTLVALVLQSTTPFGRWQDLTLLLLLVGAGLAQVFAVQSVIWTRRYMIADKRTSRRPVSNPPLRPAWSCAPRCLCKDRLISALFRYAAMV